MDAHDSPDRERSRRQQQYDSAFLPDSDETQARHYNWVQICLISAMGLAVGVMGTAAYVIWFSRDQAAYVDAVQSARHPLPRMAATTEADLRIPSHAAVPTSSVSGRVIPALPTQKTAATDTGTLASDQTAADDTDADATIDDGPQQAARTAPAPGPSAARADRGKQAGNANRHAAKAKPKESFVSRLTAMFRKVDYHRRPRDPGNHPDPYSHP
jgi:type IV secretory pathway VirB10-like protein